VSDSVRVACAAGLLVWLAPAVWAAEAQTGWTEVRAPHVTLKTDLRPDDARRAAQMVERTRAALLAAAWPGAKLLQPERIEVVALSNHQEFQTYFGEYTGGQFVQGSYPPTIFLYGGPEQWERRETLALEETTSILKHELSHHLAAFFYRRQPRWFAEGLAQFLETMRVSEDAKTATLGDINLQAMRAYARWRTLTVADALAWGSTFNPGDQGNVNGLYGLSWILVHWLYNTHPEEFARYQNLLIKGIEPDKAWKATFATLVLSDVDKDLNHFARYGEYRNVSLPIPEPDLTVQARPMTSSEVHATRADLALAAALSRADGKAFVQQALKELSAALADDPGNVRALRLQLSLVKPTERVALSRRATVAHPDDGLAWLTLADALRDSGENWEECTQAYRKAAQLLPDHPAAFDALAFINVQKGRPQEALPLAVTAMRMAPWDAAILDTLAAALAGVGRCSEALATQARALDMVGENSSAATRSAYAGRLAALQKKCAEASPPAAGPAGVPAGNP